ncbi:uncharacterized protein EI90DRAFT_3017830 [Cantharellus anzutake]|uniref:uncharacterized protein n=1 Tax=Cantharellus anzutake TaxID=1750568 RepID=UPI001907B897|nr:uncharacterized protein EI90DRAFT_3017830 [Cantharellus anzutake]KAF8328188.1 hypothetical protein EI90DRAFT_3017830 [Cantharellus anzutake]
MSSGQVYGKKRRPGPELFPTFWRLQFVFLTTKLILILGSRKMADNTQSSFHTVLPPPHPFLTVPKLYISQVASDVTDADLAEAFKSCIPFRPNIDRSSAIGPYKGEIDFKFLEHVLSPFPITDPPTPVPPPLAVPRVIKHLPTNTTDEFLFDLFRPYGPIASVSAQASFGPNSALVEFYDEEDAKRAEEALNYADVGGSNISVQPFQPKRGGAHTEWNASAAPFIPSGSAPYPPVPGQGRLSPYQSNTLYPSSPLMNGAPFVHGPGQQVQFAPTSGPGSSSHSGLIDPCNLFCKNLDPNIDSNDLFTYFRPFGQIVSARVMRGDNGVSRGFGFVSFQTPDQASLAMHSMNGQILGGKQIQVRLHEPKQLRQEKLAQRFATGGPLRRGSLSGRTSPAMSEFDGQNALPERHRRGSGSYYNAALAGSLKLSFELDELKALTPVVRRDVLTGEISRRLRNMDSVAPESIDSVVEALVSLNIQEVVAGIHDEEKFAAQVQTASQQVSLKEKQGFASPANPGLLHTRESAPSTPSYLTPPRAQSPTGSVATPSDREKLSAAVARLEQDPEKASAISELLFTLPKKERLLCVFNNDYLKQKVVEAREVLDADEVGETPSSNQSAPAAVQRRPPPTPVAEHGIKAASDPSILSQYPAGTNGSSQSSAVEKETAETPAPKADEPKEYTLSALGAMPAIDIVKLASGSTITGLPLPKPDLLVVKTTDEFVDSLQGKPVQQQKQLVGEKLFKVIRAFGVKGAPKITIALLDSEDLRSLCHLMNSYPEALKEKVLHTGK